MSTVAVSGCCRSCGACLYFPEYLLRIAPQRSNFCSECWFKEDGEVKPLNLRNVIREFQLKEGYYVTCVADFTDAFTENVAYCLYRKGSHRLGVYDNWGRFRSETMSLFVPAGPDYEDGGAASEAGNTKITSDGGSTDYYKLPEHAEELRHLVSYKGMSKSRGDVFKACYRLGEKEGAEILYDLRKMQFFVEDLIEMYGRGERL
jgi:hypothetical protein